MDRADIRKDVYTLTLNVHIFPLSPLSDFIEINNNRCCKYQFTKYYQIGLNNE